MTHATGHAANLPIFQIMKNKLQVLQKFVLSFALALLLSGCGSRPQCVPVSGKVLIDGKPLEAGVVRVVPGITEEF